MSTQPSASTATQQFTARYGFALAGVGLLWLALSTDLAAVRDHWPFMLLLVALQIAFAQFDFATVLVRDEAYARGSQTRLVTWSGVLLLGPTAVWFDVLSALGFSLWHMRGKRRLDSAESAHLALTLARNTLSALAALWVYRQLGGQIPLPDFTLAWASLALLATLVKIALNVLVTMPVAWLNTLQSDSRIGWLRLLDAVTFWRSALLFYMLPALLGVLAAGLYAEHGLWAYLFLVLGVLLLLVPAYRVGTKAVRDQQAAFRMRQLAAMGQVLLQEPPHSRDLSAVLARFVPAVFAPARVEVRLFADDAPTALFPAATELSLVEDSVWLALRESAESVLTRRGNPSDIIAVPVVDEASAQRIGGVVLRDLAESGSLADWLRPLEILAGHVGSALAQVRAVDQLLAAQAGAFRDEVFAQAYEAEMTLAYQKVSQELTLAGRIQNSFLPRFLPNIKGWQLSVTLEPARETSGDFYDFIELPDGRLGLLVADVADKGVGAALYMALSRTLIRTYAVEMADPADVLAAANRRILDDTNSDLFVTVFYAILDTTHGILTYCNAGHNPPYLFSAETDRITPLPRTGIPLGIVDELPWETKSVALAPGDVLVLYTDGVTEAQDEQQALFGEERLQRTVHTHLGRPAAIIDARIVDALYEFVGDAPQHDDITIMILSRTST